MLYNLIVNYFSDVTNEGTTFAPADTSSAEELAEFISDQYPFASSEVLNTVKSFYPESTQFPNHGAFFSAASNAYGEITFICPGLFINSQVNNYLAQKSWNYQYVFFLRIISVIIQGSSL